MRAYPTPKPQHGRPATTSSASCGCPPRDAAPAGPASPTTEAEAKARRAREAQARRGAGDEGSAAATVDTPAPPRSACSPTRSARTPRPPAASSRRYELSEDFGTYLNRVFGLDRADVDMKPLKRGARVTSGTVLGRIGRVSERTAPHLLFEIRPAGRGAPRIDPKPILDGWKLLESTAIYRAAGRNPFVGKDAQTPSIGQILLMSKEALAQRVLANPNIQVYGCGRSDIRSGPDRPPRAGHARVPRRLRPQADGDVAALRPLLPDDLGQRVRAHDRHRGRHRRDQRHPDRRAPGRRLDHRADDPAAADAAGDDEAAPDHLPDEVRGHGQHVRDGRPRATTSTSASARSTA